MSILPFSDKLFFVLIALFIGVAYFSKYILRNYISYSRILLSIGLFYIIFCYPKPINILIFIAYSYLIYYLFSFVIKSKNKLFGCIFLALPMILIKSEISSHGFHLNDIISMAGLSYVSFRTIHIYMENNELSKPIKIFDYISFLIFVPTILIGPIDRYERFQSDVKEGYRRLNILSFIEGFQIFIYGIMHKFIIAEFILRYWLNPIDVKSRLFLTMANSMYAYFFYLYFDFAGYSSLAIGAGKMLGIEVPLNFNKPFLALNPQDFWQRWHKSLGDWLRDYFFKPFYKTLSKYKKLKQFPLLRQNIALFLTFLLMGCWNGFRFNFILSGGIFGFYSVVHNSYIYYSKKKRRDIVFGQLPVVMIKWISIFIMFNLAAFAVYIFSGRIPF